jgi:hypothetical protein
MPITSANYPIAGLPATENDSWVAAMQQVDLPGRRHVLKRMKLAPFLYKYFSSDRTHSHENIRAAIVDSVLRLNAPSEFNDPFELAAHFVMTATDEEKRARFEAMTHEQAPHLGWRAVQANVQMLMSATAEYFTPTWQNSLKYVRENAGVYCFAGGGKNTLMWSHYGSDHKGVCLQFERVLDLATFMHALPTRYVSDLPILNWIVGFHEGIGEMLFAKHPCWQYEQESRIVLIDKARLYLRFAPQALRKLIFGCRVEGAIVDAVNGWLTERTSAGHPPVDVYFARKHETKYRLVVERDRPAVKTQN